MGLHSPTPIQAATVPLALLGRDVCACAVTGSGNPIRYFSFLANIFIDLQEKPLLFRYRFSNDYFTNLTKQHLAHEYLFWLQHVNYAFKSIKSFDN